MPFRQQCQLVLAAPLLVLAQDDFNGTFGRTPDDNRWNQQSQGSDGSSNNSAGIANPYFIAALCMVGGIVLLIGLMAVLSRRNAKRETEAKQQELSREEDAAIQAMYHHQECVRRKFSDMFSLG